MVVLSISCPVSVVPSWTGQWSVAENSLVVLSVCGPAEVSRSCAADNVMCFDMVNGQLINLGEYEGLVSMCEGIPMPVA